MYAPVLYFLIRLILYSIKVLINAAALFWVTGAASGNTNSSGAVIGLPDRERVRPSMVGRDIKAGAPIFLSASPAGIKDGASVGDLRKEPVREYIPHRTRDQRSSFAHQVEIPDRGISSMFSKLFGKNKSEDMQVQVCILQLQLFELFNDLFCFYEGYHYDRNGNVL
jgi:hypothetical protein